MATHAARAARNKAVRDRLDAAFAGISATLDIPVPPEPRRSRDPALQPIVELERFADFAESVLAATKGGGNAGYADHTVAELRDLLKERDIDVPGDARKADLIAALEQAATDEGE